MRQIKLLAVLAFWMSMRSMSAGQEPVVIEIQPVNRVHPVVTASVTYDSHSDLFTYHYGLASLRDSQQPIIGLYIGSSAPVFQIRAPEGWGGMQSSTVGGIMVDFGAVGIRERPGTARRSTALRPGEAIENLEFRSYEPPISLPAYVMGYAPPPKVPEDGRRHVVRDNRPPFPDDCYKLITVGPAPMTETPAGPGNPVDVCARTEAFKNTLRGLPDGWIKRSLRDSILHDLEQFKSNLLRGRKEKADKELLKILSRIDNAQRQQRCDDDDDEDDDRDRKQGHGAFKISDEAYFLIKASVGYLRAKAPLFQAPVS
ncbi:MAG: hypothetical protein AB1758_27040 [Candidatus Eremiobacterota bacterium]